MSSLQTTEIKKKPQHVQNEFKQDRQLFVYTIIYTCKSNGLIRLNEL